MKTFWSTMSVLPFHGLLALLGLTTVAPLQSAEPAPAELSAQAARCRRILQTSIIKFYLPNCVDGANGGYLESLQGGKFAPTGEKFLTLQGRQLWFFSTLVQENIDKEAALRAAKSGFEFLEKHFHDAKHGGYFSKVSDDGKPVDARKHVYLNSFALYGLRSEER